MNHRAIGLGCIGVGLVGMILAVAMDQPAWAALSALAAIVGGGLLAMMHPADPADSRRMASLEVELDALRAVQTAPESDDQLPRVPTVRGRANLTDPETGLFSEDYLQVALEARIASARRNLRPVAVALVEVVSDVTRPSETRLQPKSVAGHILDTIRESDTASRLIGGAFALVLDDTPENGAVWTMERLRRLMTEAEPGCTVWAGIACYPAHALDPDEMVKKAELALAAASEWRQDRIEVAVSQP